MMKLLIALFLLFLPFSARAVNRGGSSHSAEDLKINRERWFRGEALYGFMNGGSELYLEYGFKELQALEVTYRGEEYTIEIYRMETPEDAFGIYSIHTFNSLFRDTLFTFDCHSKFQLQTIRGCFYYSVVFDRARDAINHDAAELLRIFIKDDNAAQPQFPEPLGEIERPVTGKLKYVRGPLALISCSPTLSDWLQNITNYKLWLLNEEGGEKIKVIFLTQNSASLSLLKSRLPLSAIIFEESELLFFSFSF